MTKVQGRAHQSGGQTLLAGLNIRIPDWVFLIACCAFFFLWRLASFGLIGADEPRYAQVAREMFARHDWITPTLGGSVWLEKPPLYYWQAILAYRIFGVSDWAARLPSVLDATLLVFLVYFLLRRLRSYRALDAGLVLASCAGVVGYARAASMDMPLASTFSIAMLAWYVWRETRVSAYLALFYGFLGLAMLAKGPVSPFLAGLILLLFFAWQRDWSCLQPTLWWPGILLFCAISLPWYILVQIRNPDFFRVFILEHNLARFGTNVFHHPEPFWYYVPVTLAGWIPWSLFVVVAVVAVVREFGLRTRDPFNMFLIAWAGAVVVFFSLSRSKLPGYVLPAILPGALILTRYVHARFAHRLHPLLAIAHGVISAALIFASLLLHYTVLEHHVPWNNAATPAIAATTIGLLVCFLLLKSGYAVLRTATLIPAVLALTIALRFGSAAINDTMSTRSVSDALSRVSRQQLPVAAVLVSRETEFGLHFYRDQKIPRYELKQAPPGEHLVVAREGFRNAFARDIPGRRIVYLGNFPEQRLEFFYVSAAPSSH
jgi:4-amino-4-deoxy-L-arabinose transferase-like glycosyltransferase